MLFKVGILQYISVNELDFTLSRQESKNGPQPEYPRVISG